MTANMTRFSIIVKLMLDTDCLTLIFHRLSSSTNSYQPIVYVSATPWGTLPVFEVDGVTIGQSIVIARFAAREFGKQTDSI